MPYCLFELRAKAPEDSILIVEVEKDVDRLAGLGFVVSCNAGGANKWPAELNPHFEGHAVCILPDNDDAGHSHAEKVAASLPGVAASIRIVSLPGLARGGDVSDWLDAGGDTDRLVALCQAAPTRTAATADRGSAPKPLPPSSTSPTAVIEATAEYFDDEDSFGRWLAECCVRDPMAHETTRDLYAAWSVWAERSGMSAGTEPKFRSALKARGFESKRLPGANISGFLGVRLNREDYTNDLRYGG
ncbi:hypothetical protein DF3PA_270002 [Candidatus Defluviicoccus seviourii]|uniref:DNA primase/helicase n=1 Tax=Candidatus Defluviicoccus seviourii TaxID=2565273 RepID=A0A564WDX9_9PROT|nr:hypothetical protein DF3PA_270002 [Candidatus Defluviicoccus seviourii]